MAQYSESFDGGAVGADITAANTGFTDVLYNTSANGSATFDSALIAAGQSARLVSDSTGTRISLKRTLPAATATMKRRIYMRVNAAPTRFYFLDVLNGGTDVANVRRAADGTIEMRDGFVKTAGTTTVVPTGSIVRVEHDIDGTAGTQELRLYLTDPNAATPDETITGAFSGGSVDTLFCGITASEPSIDITLDEVAADPSTSPGPIVTTHPRERLTEMELRIVGSAPIPARERITEMKVKVTGQSAPVTAKQWLRVLTAAGVRDARVHVLRDGNL